MQQFLESVGVNRETASNFALRLGLIAVLTVVAVVAVNRIFKRLRVRWARGGRNVALIGLVRFVLLAAIYIVAIGAVVSGSAKSALGTVLASSGLAAVVISIAAQEPIGNMCSGVFIILSRPFKIGDVVRYTDKDITGTVESITLRHTVIRTYENKRLIIPNGVMNKSVIENSSYSGRKVSFPLDFSVTYESDLRTAMQLISDVVIYNTVRDGDFIPPENEDAAALVNRMEESGIVLRVWVWAETLEASYRLKSDIMLGVHRRFGDEGVRFAYPHVQIIDNPQST